MSFVGDRFSGRIARQGRQARKRPVPSFAMDGAPRIDFGYNPPSGRREVERFPPETFVRDLILDECFTATRNDQRLLRINVERQRVTFDVDMA